MHYNKAMRGLFIVVDGPSATGKDTLISLLGAQLKKENYHVFSYEEIEMPEYDRRKILAAKTQGDNAVAQAFIEERKKLYDATIAEKIQKGDIVIANRGEPSTLVYQTLGSQISINRVWEMHRNNHIQLPDLIVLTTCSIEEATRRDMQRNRTEDTHSIHGKFTRAEDEEATQKKRLLIHIQYEKVKVFLREKGVHIVEVNTENNQNEESLKTVMKYIKQLVFY